MIYNVCVVTGTRADYGLLRELLFRLKNNEEIDLNLLVTGSHLSEAFGNTHQEIISDGFDKYVSIPIPLEDDTKGGMAKATGVALYKFADYFELNTPDMVIVLGDRYEILSAVIAARLQGISVAHISGGDVTEGAIDDSIRHSITKMSQIHFPGCELSRHRIIQMGEQPDTVFNVGEPGVENCLKMKLLGREELARNISFDGILQDYAVVTFHPVTVENNTGIRHVKELIRAMDSFSNMNYVVTMANADAGGRSINKIWVEEGEKHDNWIVVPSLGVQRYLSTVKYAKMIIGNSSSGIIEAPSMGIPTVNIGDRQKGRMLAQSVVTCSPSCSDIIKSCKIALSKDFRLKLENNISPFGDGHTSILIEQHIMGFLKNKEKFYEKHFYDIPTNLKESENA